MTPADNVEAVARARDDRAFALGMETAARHVEMHFPEAAAIIRARPPVAAFASVQPAPVDGVEVQQCDLTLVSAFTTDDDGCHLTAAEERCLAEHAARHRAQAYAAGKADERKRCAKIAEKWRDENKAAAAKARKRDTVFGSNGLADQIEGAAIECNAIAAAIRNPNHV